VELLERDADPDPLRQLERWLREEPLDRAALATATRDGLPSVRMVLLKRVDASGLSFFSGYTSRKGRELEANPRAALLLYWPAHGRQVRVEGEVERLGATESDAYWETRPQASRVSAAASPQSEVVADRATLEALVADAGEAPPRPEHWGGYRLSPTVWEFWQHRADRLHDRLRYRPGGDAWVIERLTP
jgi:pyridoxamine 5'-phosphate oxidase